MGAMSPPKSFPPPGELQPDQMPNRNVMAVTPPTQTPMPAGITTPYTSGVATPTVASPNSTNTSIAPQAVGQTRRPVLSPYVNKINQYSEYL